MKPDFSGNWRLLLEKSKLAGSQPRRAVVRIEHDDPRLVDIGLFTYADGSTVRDVFEATTSGEEFFNFLRGARVTSRAAWEGDELLIESWAKIGERDVHFRDFWSLSESKDTLTMQHRDDDLAGQVAVFARFHESIQEIESGLPSNADAN